MCIRDRSSAAPVGVGTGLLTSQSSEVSRKTEEYQLPGRQSLGGQAVWLGDHARSAEVFWLAGLHMVKRSGQAVWLGSQQSAHINIWLRRGDLPQYVINSHCNYHLLLFRFAFLSVLIDVVSLDKFDPYKLYRISFSLHFYRLTVKRLRLICFMWFDAFLNHHVDLTV